MSPRKYQQSRRAEAAAETRRRIIEATFALHSEKGIAATTFRDIASRADVGIGTVFHHFPTYEDVIGACGAYSWEITSPPLPETLAAIADPRQRVKRLIGDIFSFYQRFPTMGRARSERHQFKALDAAFQQEEAHRRALIDAAFRGLHASAPTRAIAFALLDFSTWENLLQSGIPHDAATDEVADILMNRLNLKGKTR